MVFELVGDVGKKEESGEAFFAEFGRSVKSECKEEVAEEAFDKVKGAFEVKVEVKAEGTFKVEKKEGCGFAGKVIVKGFGAF